MTNEYEANGPGRPAIPTHVRKLLYRFSQLYGPPPAGNVDLFNAEYARSLSAVDPDLLDAAVSRIIDRNTKPFWPTIGECREVVRAVAEERDNRAALSAPANQQRLAPPAKPTKDAKAAVDTMVKDLLEGWKQRDKERAAEAMKSTNAKIDWNASTKPAWEQRLRESSIAREFAVSRELRDLIVRQKKD